MASEQQPAAAPHPANPSPEMAIAFVVESSLTVASDWSRIIADYVSPILRRLYESNPSAKRRLAFITYATADTVPSPLLCKRFFLDSQPVTTEMRESPASLGIGTTNSGGDRGMAALEGLVAAIELFEVFTGAVGRGKLVLSHIIHIASVAPDSSVHPRFNDSPKYDDMTWDTMADEMRNRNINFNTINLVPNLKRFSELHAKASKDALKPFFSIRPPHSVLLAGIPSSSQKASATAPAPAPSAPAKRPGSDVHSTPDPKRARLAPPMDVSPKVQTPNTPSSQAKPSPLLAAQPKVQPRTPVLPPAPAAVPAPSMTPTFPQVPVNASQNVPNPKENFLNVFRNIEMQIRSLRAAIQNAQNAGDAMTVQNLTQELNKKQTLQQRAKEYLMKMNSQAQAAQAQLRNSTPGLIQEAPIVQQAISPPPGQPLMDQQQQQQQALATMLHKRTASGSGPPGPGSGPNNMQPQGLMTPQGNNANLVAQMQQMQKMADQQRARSMQQMLPGPSNAPAATMPPAGPPPLLPPSVDPRPPNKGSNSVWQGSLVFSATDVQGVKKDNVIWVLGKVQSPPEESRIDTWPTTMQLSLANKPAVPRQDLQAWIQTNRPVLCLFQPQTNGIPDPVANEANFKALIAFLHQRNSYAVSAWTLPSGDQGNNVLFFPVNMSGLAAACFPTTGLPELPSPSRRPNQMLNVDFNNPEFRARLQALPPEQREQFVKAVKVQRALQMRQQIMNAQSAANNPMNAMNLAQPTTQAMQQQVQVQQSPPPQQQQQQQQPQLPDTTFVGNVHPVNYAGVGMMNAMGLSGQQQQQPQTMMAGMSRPGNNGNGMRSAMPANINYEMMQSFMSRNPDGGGGMGQ